uniref:Putative secreted protein n=1 Tax=Xenopsylla cheopis TaxID=163159 RepID=A0A6M2DZ64_XENCH
MRKLCAKWMPLCCFIKTMSQIIQNNGKNRRIGFRIAPPSPVFSKFGHQRLFPIRRPQCSPIRNLGPMKRR